VNNKTHFLENAVINHFLRNSTQSSPTAVYVALYTVAPTKSSGGTEVTGTDYARVEGTFSAPSNGATSNSGPISFATAGTGGWGEVVACGILNAETGGDLMYFGTLSAQKTIDEGDTVTFATAALQVSET
jgi:hypothetical protein